MDLFDYSAWTPSYDMNNFDSVLNDYVLFDSTPDWTPEQSQFIYSNLFQIEVFTIEGDGSTTEGVSITDPDTGIKTISLEASSESGYILTQSIYGPTGEALGSSYIYTTSNEMSDLHLVDPSGKTLETITKQELTITEEEMQAAMAKKVKDIIDHL